MCVERVSRPHVRVLARSCFRSDIPLVASPTKPGNYTCHIGHMHPHVVATRDDFHTRLRRFDSQKTDEVLGVVYFAAVSCGIGRHEPSHARENYGLSKILGVGGGITVPLAGATKNPTRGHDILLLAYLHGRLDVRQMLLVGDASEVESLEAFIS